MNQYDFDKLVQKYLAGEASPEEEKLMHRWAEARLEESKLQLNTDDKQVVEKRIWKRIHNDTLRQQPFFVRYRWSSISVVAASIVVCITVAGFFWKQPEPNQITQVSATEKSDVDNTINIRNTTNKPQEIRLKDGSLVMLNARSSISYPAHFGAKTRQVYLQGEALFDVKKDATRPFIVHTGNLVTQVLGTSFTVKSYEEDKAIEVLVTRGRVSVYENSEKSANSRNGVILIPNQKITFDKASQKLTPALVEAPRMIQPPEARSAFVFDKTPLTNVFNVLNKAYGIDFLIENQVLSHCVFTGDLTDLPLYVQLDLVCKSVNATYERRGTTLFIHGEGCPD
ncbi:FecR family protein [Spirosoma validum]|uniref:FecR domain-containing protein n=1 Tax=Spirosoma validum TaxID=2771355 RepID=A0A927GBS7_9BACT|nr:FecR family protein [Spirosoma validum]MBD2751795.1 FecR domain-containing protein [Spirosoma validum]